MRPTFKTLSVLSLGILLTAACSSSGGSTDGGTDAQQPTKDGGKEAAPTGDAAAQCSADSSYTGALTQQTASYSAGDTDAGADAGPQDSYQYQGAYNSDADLLDIEIYDGYGVFANGVQPGTYTLSGDELDYATCGLCVLFLGDATQSSADPYMATGGSITITSVSPSGTFAGTGTNLAFTHVSIDENTNESTALNDGCNTSIASVSFSATVSQQ